MGKQKILRKLLKQSTDSLDDDQQKTLALALERCKDTRRYTERIKANAFARQHFGCNCEQLLLLNKDRDRE